MGFLKRLLGLEQKPGEPKSLSDVVFADEVLKNERPCIVDFYSLWCSPCQVMSGLLNELGPGYIGRVDFFKMDVTKHPYAPSRYNISSVPTVIAFKNGKPVKRLVGLIPIDELKLWIDELVE